MWVFIFVLNFAMRGQTPVVGEKSAPPSPEVLVELKKQQRMFAELMGSAQTPDADRRKFSPKPRSAVNITNLNPDTDIGASSWLVELDEHRLLLDAGMHLKREGREGLPLFARAGNNDVDAIVISTFAITIMFVLPVALRHFPKAHVLMSELSYFIVERVLHNSVNVMTRQRDELGIREYPLYTHDEVDDIAPRFQAFKYNREVEWASFNKMRAGFTSPTLEFFDAGHTIGSVVMVRGKKETLLFIMTYVFNDQTILRSAV